MSNNDKPSPGSPDKSRFWFFRLRISDRISIISATVNAIITILIAIIANNLTSNANKLLDQQVKLTQAQSDLAENQNKILQFEQTPRFTPNDPSVDETNFRLINSGQTASSVLPRFLSIISVSCSNKSNYRNYFFAPVHNGYKENPLAGLYEKGTSLDIPHSIATPNSDTIEKISNIIRSIDWNGNSIDRVDIISYIDIAFSDALGRRYTQKFSTWRRPSGYIIVEIPRVDSQESMIRELDWSDDGGRVNINRPERIDAREIQNKWGKRCMG